MSMRTLSMLGSRASTPRYGTLNSSRDFRSGLAAESRTLDRSHSSTFDRAQHARNGVGGFERLTLPENSRPQNFERMATLDGEQWMMPATSPVSLQTFNAPTQQPRLLVRNGGTRDVAPLPKYSQVGLGYVEMNHRGTVFTCICYVRVTSVFWRVLERYTQWHKKLGCWPPVY